MFLETIDPEPHKNFWHHNCGLTSFMLEKPAIFFLAQDEDDVTLSI
jgi:hypothetical protein